MLKKFILITIIGMFVFHYSSAQEFKKLNFQFDFGANVSIPNNLKVETMTDFDGHPITRYYPCSGYFGEIQGSYHFTSQLNIQSGITYIYNRIRIIDKAGFQKNTGRINTSFIQIPFLVNYKIKAGKPYNIAIGPYIGYILEVRQKGVSKLNLSEINYDDQNDPLLIDNMEYEYNDNISSNFINYDFGLSLQGSYMLQLSNQKSLVFFSRLNYGLTDISSNYRESFTKYTAKKLRNINLLFGIGYRI